MNAIRSALRVIYRAVPFKKPVFLVWRAVARPRERIYRHFHFVAPITIPTERGRYFKIHHFGHQVENDLFWAGYGNNWEATSLRLWIRLASDSRTIFDIGANTGVYALAAKSINATSEVFAFEPVARIADRLRENVALNGWDIQVIEAAVSSRTGDAFIYVPATGHAYSASLNESMLSNQANITKSKVRSLRIDDFIKSKNLKSADLFKIDTEKHEMDVISGFGKTIEQFRPLILIEILNREIGVAVEQYFTGQDYIFYEIVEGAQLRRIRELGSYSRNYFICPNEYAAQNGLGDIIPHDAL